MNFESFPQPEKKKPGRKPRAIAPEPESPIAEAKSTRKKAPAIKKNPFEKRKERQNKKIIETDGLQPIEKIKTRRTKFTEPAPFNLPIDEQQEWSHTTEAPNDLPIEASYEQPSIDDLTLSDIIHGEEGPTEILEPDHGPSIAEKITGTSDFNKIQESIQKKLMADEWQLDSVENGYDPEFDDMNESLSLQKLREKYTHEAKQESKYAGPTESRKPAKSEGLWYKFVKWLGRTNPELEQKRAATFSSLSENHQEYPNERVTNANHHFLSSQKEKPSSIDRQKIRDYMDRQNQKPYQKKLVDRLFDYLSDGLDDED